MECDSGEVERERVGSEWGVKVWSLRVGGVERVGSVGVGEV